MKNEIIKTLKMKPYKIPDLAESFLENFRKIVGDDKTTHIVLPPIKAEGNENLKWFEDLLIYNGWKDNIIKIKSPYYSLHNSNNQSLDEREKRIENASKEWETDKRNILPNINKIVIVDDIYTAGSTSRNIIKFLKENGFKSLKKEGKNRNYFYENVFGLFLAKTTSSRYTNDKNYLKLDSELSDKINNMTTSELRKTKTLEELIRNTKSEWDGLDSSYDIVLDMILNKNKI